MSWPNDVIDAIDISWYQQKPGGGAMDLDKMLAKHPNIKLVFIRAVWPSGKVDSLYSTYYDMVVDSGRDVAAYVWPNPIRTMDEMRGNWHSALSQRPIPKVIMNDLELTFNQDNDVITDNADESFDALEEDYPDSEIIGYTRGEWWDRIITRPIEAGRKFVVAHYVKFMINGEWQFCRSHADLKQFLPIDNSFTPFTGRLDSFRVIGWQICAKGRVPPYHSDVDLDSIKGSWYREVYGGENPPTNGEIPKFEIEAPEGCKKLTIEVSI